MTSVPPPLVDRETLVDVYAVARAAQHGHEVAVALVLLVARNPQVLDNGGSTTLERVGRVVQQLPHRTWLKTGSMDADNLSTPAERMRLVHVSGIGLLLLPILLAGVGSWIWRAVSGPAGQETVTFLGVAAFAGGVIAHLVATAGFAHLYRRSMWFARRKVEPTLANLESGHMQEDSLRFDDAAAQLATLGVPPKSTVDSREWLEAMAAAWWVQGYSEKDIAALDAECKQQVVSERRSAAVVFPQFAGVAVAQGLVPDTSMAKARRRRSWRMHTFQRLAVAIMAGVVGAAIALAADLPGWGASAISGAIISITLPGNARPHRFSVPKQLRPIMGFVRYGH